MKRSWLRAGEQYGSEIPGWYISLSSQESAATLTEWTARQEQVLWERSWIQFECSGLEGVGVVKNTSDYYAIRETKCGQGLYYRAFAWAYAWAPGVAWKSANELSKPWQCTGNWAEPVEEFLDNIKKD